MSDETDGERNKPMKPSLALLMFVALRKYLNPDPPKPVLHSLDEKADRAVNWAIYGGGAAVVVFVSVVAMMSGGH
jgi:hypothetical protein